MSTLFRPITIIPAGKITTWSFIMDVFLRQFNDTTDFIVFIEISLLVALSMAKLFSEGTNC